MDGLTRIAEVSAAATAAGINPWLAALTLVGLAHFGWMDLGALPVVGSELGEPAILAAVGLAFLVEQVADKIPALDHVSDLIHLPIKPAAAIALALAVAAPEDPSQLGQYVVPLAIAAAGVALLTHLGKAGLRAGSTATTAGVANPVLSVLEDLGVVLMIVAAVVVPLLALVAVVLALGLAGRGLWRLVGRRRGSAAAILLPLALLPRPARAQEPCESVGDPAAVTAIESARAEFNEAIASADLDAIAAVLHPEVLLVTGTDSDVFRGRPAQLAIWESDFGDPDRAVYVRTPHCVRVSSVFPVALELGEWRGERPAVAGEARDFAAGRYAAKWRRVEGIWLLESEVFATETCGGAFCPVGRP